jgi:hypothetical protein
VTTPLDPRPLTLADYAAAGTGAVVLVTSALATVIAAIHRAQIDDVDAYRESWLILPELGALLCSCGNQPFVAIAFVVLLVRKRWKLAAALACAGVLGLVLAYGAVALDAPTLLYAS